MPSMSKSYNDLQAQNSASSESHAISYEGYNPKTALSAPRIRIGALWLQFWGSTEFEIPLTAPWSLDIFDVQITQRSKS